MAAEVGAAASIVFSILWLMISCQISSSQAASIPCTANDYKQILLPCNQETRKRKAVFYLDSKCDPAANTSVSIPAAIDNLPCQCEPGYGEQHDIKTRQLSCEKCAAGEYSHGGELISDWKNWNGTSGVPGSGFNVHVYCTDFMYKKPCRPWQPAGEGEYLVSGTPKNATELRCFEQSVLVMNRVFVGDKNYLSFEYRVDGSQCLRNQGSTCGNGLYLYLQNKKTGFKVDYQFQWLTFKIGVDQGPVQIRFVYQRSCTKQNILDVAYIRNIALVGTSSGKTVCSKCPPGSFSSLVGATNCTKCGPNEYQPLSGQQKCNKCKENQFSRIGEVTCYDLPTCSKNDYYLLPEATKKCNKDGDTWMRKQSVYRPRWPGTLTTYACAENVTVKPSTPDIQCRCNFGSYLNVKKSFPRCSSCPLGKYSDGTFLDCASCNAGSAAIPGYYMNNFPEGNPPSVLEQKCSGQFCPNSSDSQFWEHRGSYMATKRLPGNFETTLSFHDIDIDYFNASFRFKCSLDCRISPGGDKLAKHDHCFMKIVIEWNSVVIKDVDCVGRYRGHYRNGTIRSHSYKLRGPGKYTFKALFHHEDEANNSMVSYEARLHYVEITGARKGSARECTVCPAGTRVSDDKAFCVMCPPGTYSLKGSSKCKQCPENTFSNKNASAKCTPCGSGTKANKNRDGCDYNDCKFEAADGVVYDLAPLSRKGGPMYQVKSYRSGGYFPVLYFVNLCSLEHDNSSCMVTRKEFNLTSRRYDIAEKTSLKTMACKRWGFDSLHSYSIGEVMNFIPLKENVTSGLMINLTGGYRCWHQGHKRLSTPSTSILMICDLFRGVGVPEPLVNGSRIGGDSSCHFELRWRTTYACPLCTDKDFSTVYSACENGRQTVTYSRISQCRTETDVFTKQKSCTASGSSNAPLVATVVIAVIFILILIAFVVYYVRRNRLLRGQLFVPGKAFSKVQDEDAEELVDNMLT